MADDDLDAFFDDVDNAVKEVQDTAEDQNVEASSAVTATSATAATSNVDETTAASPEPKSEDEHHQRRPAKRVKAVVASSVPVISIAPPLPSGPPPPNNSTSSFGNNAIPPPPPPPPNHLNSQSNNNNVHQQNNPPPLPPPPPSSFDNGTGKAHVRSAAGTTWSDPTLSQWPANDFRLFVGNLAKDLKQHHLEEHFQKYPSFAMARVMFDKSDGKSRGYGFVSVMDAKDCARAIREMDQSWLGSRPIKVKLSEWKDREWKEVKKRGKDRKRKKKHFGL